MKRKSFTGGKGTVPGKVLKTQSASDNDEKENEIPGRRLKLALYEGQEKVGTARRNVDDGHVKEVLASSTRMIARRLGPEELTLPDSQSSFLVEVEVDSKEKLKQLTKAWLSVETFQKELRALKGEIEADRTKTNEKFAKIKAEIKEFRILNEVAPMLLLRAFSDYCLYQVYVAAGIDAQDTQYRTDWLMTEPFVTWMESNVGATITIGFKTLQLQPKHIQMFRNLRLFSKDCSSDFCHIFSPLQVALVLDPADKDILVLPQHDATVGITAEDLRELFSQMFGISASLVRKHWCEDKLGPQFSQVFRIPATRAPHAKQLERSPYQLAPRHQK